ncbi:hypothetical protein [Niabella hibiscisoli]|uniref:hypothetical protein n=1 Tax=Niabella hibiscisoli TaxID=1825928 RepID=UPI001F0DA175|nr:hypothetical protein [Niabella hibiscisoli]MCH5714816.1 hypothetical protein [Niabella hibiscisoli]
MRIIAEQLSDDLKEWASTHAKVVIEERLYDPFDIQHADALVVATSDPVLVEQINNDATEYGLANVRIGHVSRYEGAPVNGTAAEKNHQD